ncbi:MAG: ATP-binding protein [Rhodoferax sp.]
MADIHSQPGTDEAVQHQMARLRATSIERLWCALAGLSLVMLPVLLWRAYAMWSGSQVGSRTTNYVFMAGSLFLIGMFPYRSRLPVQVRAVLPLAALVVVSQSSLFGFGAASTAFSWMVQCCLLIATLYSLRAGLWATAATAASAVLAGALFLNGVLVVPVDLNAFFAQPVAWLLMIVAVTVVPAIIVYIIGDYQRMIAALLRRMEDKRNQLDTMSRQLTQALQAQEQASAAKNAFLAHMTHELRTPLTGVIGMLEIADKRNHDPDLNRVLDVARHSAEALLKVINDVLDYSKLDAGKITLQPEPFDLAEFLRNALEVFHWRAREKGIEFKVSIAPELPTLRCADPQRLRQVLFNLVSNAMKFTETGWVCVEVTQAAAPNALHFCVRDSGIGIAADVLPRLFDEFEQGDSSIHKRYGGTGLGLAITKLLVQAMGGSIQVQSVERVGTIFTIDLPMPVGTPSAIATEAAASDPNTAPVQLHVLLAEDSPTNQLVVSMLLQDLGHHVVVADNGRMAVACAARENFDLILMDMRMPELAGCEAAALIRQGGTAQDTVFDRDVYICAFTANAAERDRAAAMAVGMNDFLTKPVRMHDMQALLQRVVAYQRARGVGLHEPAELAAMVPTESAPPAIAPLPALSSTAQEHLASIFRRDLELRQPQIQAALEQAQWEQLRDVAHLVKGAALSAGVTDLVRAADALERACLAQPFQADLCADHAHILLRALEHYMGASI